MNNHKDERAKIKHNLNHISHLGYDQPLDQSYLNTNNQLSADVEQNENNFSPNPFNEVVEKLFFSVQNELESIDCENMLSNLENILNLVKEDITRKFTTSKNLHKINEIFQNNFEIVKDYFKRCLTHTINVKVNIFEIVRNGCNELNEIHTHDLENGSKNFSNFFQNKQGNNFFFDESFIELINNLSTIIKDYVKNSRTCLKSLTKSSDLYGNKNFYIKTNLTNLLSQNLLNTSGKTYSAHFSKTIKNLIEKFDEGDSIRLGSLNNLKLVEAEGLKFYEDAKVIFKNLKILHNTKLSEIQNLNENNYRQSDTFDDFSSGKTCSEFIQTQSRNKGMGPMGNTRSKSIDFRAQEKRKSDSVSPIRQKSFGVKKQQSNSNFFNNTSTGTGIGTLQSIYNTSANLDHSSSITHSNVNNSRISNQSKHKPLQALHKLNKSVDSFNSRNKPTLGRNKPEISASNVALSHSRNASNAPSSNLTSNPNNVNSMKNTAQYIADYNKLFADFEILNNKNAELNLHLGQLHEAYTDNQSENQRLKSENDMYYKHLIAIESEGSIYLNSNQASNDVKYIKLEDVNRSQAKSRSSHLQMNDPEQINFNFSNVESSYNLDKLSSMTIAFIDHMTQLQESISRKLPNVKEMKKEFELKKKELIDFANCNVKSSANKFNSVAAAVDKAMNTSAKAMQTEKQDRVIVDNNNSINAGNILANSVPCEKCVKVSDEEKDSQNCKLQIENYNNIINNLNAEKEKFNLEINTLSEEIKKSNTKSFLQKRFEDENKILNSDLDKCKELNEQLMNENKKLYCDNQTMAEEFTKLQDYFQTMEDAKLSEIKSAKDSDKKNSTIKDLEEKLKILNDDLKSKESQIENFILKVNSLNDEKNSYWEILCENKNIIEDLNKKNLSNTDDKKNLCEQVNALNLKFKNLNETNNNLNKIKINLENEIKELKEKNKELNSKIETSHQNHIQIEEKLSHTQKENKKLFSEKNELVGKLELEKKEFTKLENKLKEYDTNIIPNLKKTQEKYEKKIDQEFELKLQQHYETLSRRENELMELKEKFKKLQSQNISSTSTGDNQIDNLKSKIEIEKNSHKVYENLNSDYTKICQSVKNIHTKFSIKFNELKNLNSKISSHSVNYQNKNRFELEKEILNDIYEEEEDQTHSIIDEEISIKEEEDIEEEFYNEEKRNLNKKFAIINPERQLLKETTDTISDLQKIYTDTLDILQEKIKIIKSFASKEAQYIEENLKLKNKFDECIQIIHDTFAASSPHLLEPLGLLDMESESKSNFSDSKQREIEIDFIQKAVDLFRLIVTEINEENKKLKNQIEEMRIFKIKAEEYKAIIDLAMNREEISQRSLKSQRSQRKSALLTTPSLAMCNSPLNNNSDFMRDNMYEVNLTVEDLIEDKNVFLDIIKKQQLNKEDKDESEENDDIYSVENEHEENLQLVLNDLKKKYEEGVIAYTQLESSHKLNQAEYTTLMENFKEEQAKADDFKQKYESLVKESELVAINNDAVKLASINKNKNQIVIPKLELKAINQSLVNKEDINEYEEEEEDEEKDLEKFNKSSYNPYASENSLKKEEINLPNRNLNKTTGIITNQPTTDYFSKLNKNAINKRTPSYNLEHVRTEKSEDSFQSENYHDDIVKYEENERLLLEQLKALKDELKQTRQQRDQYKKFVEDSSKLDLKTEIVKALKPMIEKLILEITLNEKIKQILSVILKILSCSEDQIKQIFYNKETNKKTFFGNIFGGK